MTASQTYVPTPFVVVLAPVQASLIPVRFDTPRHRGGERVVRVEEEVPVCPHSLWPEHQRHWTQPKLWMLQHFASLLSFHVVDCKLLIINPCSDLKFISLIKRTKNPHCDRMCELACNLPLNYYSHRGSPLHQRWWMKVWIARSLQSKSKQLGGKKHSNCDCFKSGKRWALIQLYHRQMFVKEVSACVAEMLEWGWKSTLDVGLTVDDGLS